MSKVLKFPYTVRESENGTFSVVNADGHTIAMIEYRLPAGHAKQIATLFASAPHMYQALQKADKVLARVSPDSTSRGPVRGKQTWGMIHDAGESVETALAAARGHHD